jgi:cytochrome c5
MRSIYFIPVTLTALTVTAIAVATSHSTPARSGEAVFATNCAKCHTGGIGGFFSSAPDIEDPEDWEALTPKGLDALTANTITGVGDMAARGACAQCTDEEIRATVEYMLENIQ